MSVKYRLTSTSGVEVNPPSNFATKPHHYIMPVPSEEKPHYAAGIDTQHPNIPHPEDWQAIHPDDPFSLVRLRIEEKDTIFRSGHYFPTRRGGIFTS